MGAEQQLKINHLRRDLSKSRRINVVGGWLLMAILAWVVVGEVVFAFRHPWATDTERLLWIGHAMTFQKVPYETMRPRE